MIRPGFFFTISLFGVLAVISSCTTVFIDPIATEQGLSFKTEAEPGEHCFEGIWFWTFEGSGICIVDLASLDLESDWCRRNEYAHTCYHSEPAMDSENFEKISAVGGRAIKRGAKCARIRFCGEFKPDVRYSDNSGMFRGLVVVRHVYHFEPVGI